MNIHKDLTLLSEFCICASSQTGQLYDLRDISHWFTQVPYLDSEGHGARRAKSAFQDRRAILLRRPVFIEWKTVAASHGRP